MTDSAGSPSARPGPLARLGAMASRGISNRPLRMLATLLLLAALVAWISVRSGASPSSAPTTVSGPYGSVQGDSRNNHEIGRGGNELAYRFRARTTSPLQTIRVQQRGQGGGDSYSGGDGGTIRISIETDDGGQPSGTVLSSFTFAPGNPVGDWETWPALRFPQPATLTAGQLYEVVFENVSSAPDANWISLNALFYWGGTSPRQPTISDDMAVLYASPSRWVVQTGETPIMDLGYADGSHDGMGYIGAMGQHYGSISGPSQMVREHFTVTGANRAVTSANVKVKRISGTSPLTIELERGDGTLIESIDVPATAIPVGDLPLGEGEEALGGNTWAAAAFRSPEVLASGQTYNLRLSTASGTQYIAVPVQEGTDKGLASYRFTDGDGQQTVDGGSRWANLYDFGYVDLQFFFQ